MAAYIEAVLRIGVKVPVRISRLGELIADVSALEAAGADSIWLEAEAPADAAWFITLGVLLAATQRLKIGLIASPVNQSGEVSVGLELIRSLTDRALAATRSESGLRVAPNRWPTGDAEPWAEVALGRDRAAWQQELEAQTQAGRVGILVSWDPRLIDLLRNPDQEDDRSDLLISTG